MSNKKSQVILTATIVLCLSAIGVAVTKLYKLAQVRQDYYGAGINSLNQGNCDRAMEQFTALSAHGAFLDRFDRLSDTVKPYQQECSAWQKTQQEVNEAQENDDFAQALISYDHFVKNNSGSSLVQFAKREVKALFENLEIAQLASDKSCKQIDSLVQQELIPDRDRFLPSFYVGCIEVYQNAEDDREEFSHQVKFLTAYPTNNQALEVKQGLIENSLVCHNSAQLQSNDTVTQWGNLMPVIYLACGKAYQSVADYPQAIAFYQTLLVTYPDSDLTQKAEDNLAAIDREVAQIRAQMQIAADNVKARIGACTAGSIFLDWAIDLGEFITGKDCMTGKSLHDVERLMTVIPLIDGFQNVGKVSRAWQVIDTVRTFTAINRTQNLLEDYQTLFELLDDREEIELLAAHNSRLMSLVARKGKSLDLSQHHQDFVQLLE
ncbi:MAG: hypothetical protein AAFQ14_10780 [Cyanobacteria bacterium J06621_12]